MSNRQLSQLSPVRCESSYLRLTVERGEKSIVVRTVVDVEEVLARTVEGDLQTANASGRLRDRGDWGPALVVPGNGHIEGDGLEGEGEKRESVGQAEEGYKYPVAFQPRLDSHSGAKRTPSSGVESYLTSRILIARIRLSFFHRARRSLMNVSQRD